MLPLRNQSYCYISKAGALSGVFSDFQRNALPTLDCVKSPRRTPKMKERVQISDRA